MSSKLHRLLHRKPFPTVTLDLTVKTERKIYKPDKLTLIRPLLRMTHTTLPFSHLELYCAVLSGGTFPRLR